MAAYNFGTSRWSDARDKIGSLLLLILCRLGQLWARPTSLPVRAADREFFLFFSLSQKLNTLWIYFCVFLISFFLILSYTFLFFVFVLESRRGENERSFWPTQLFPILRVILGLLLSCHSQFQFLLIHLFSFFIPKGRRRYNHEIIGLLIFFSFLPLSFSHSFFLSFTSSSQIA